MPRQIARIEMASVCNHPVDLHNQFYEYLRFGNGRMPKILAREFDKRVQVFTRNNVPGFADISGPPQFVIAYMTDPADIGKRVLVQGLDQNNVPVVSQDGQNPVQGLYAALNTPFVTISTLAGAAQPFNQITGYQKDITSGPVQFFQMDPTTGAQSLLHTMEPGETTGWYRRYYLNGLPPAGCCPTNSSGLIQIQTLCKLEPIPVQYPTDYTLLQNVEAFIEECQSIRYGDMDVPNAKGFEARHHQKAVGLLNGELAHYMGINEPAVEFAPFGSAKLERVNITMI